MKSFGNCICCRNCRGRNRHDSCWNVGMCGWLCIIQWKHWNYRYNKGQTVLHRPYASRGEGYGFNSPPPKKNGTMVIHTTTNSNDQNTVTCFALKRLKDIATRCVLRTESRECVRIQRSPDSYLNLRGGRSGEGRDRKDWGWVNMPAEVISRKVKVWFSWI